MAAFAGVTRRPCSPSADIESAVSIPRPRGRGRSFPRSPRTRVPGSADRLIFAPPDRRAGTGGVADGGNRIRRECGAVEKDGTGPAAGPVTHWQREYGR